MTEPVASLTYEQALEKLDETLRSIEEGNLSLEDALKAVEQARVYLLACQERLDAARKRIEVRPEAPAAGPGSEPAQEDLL